MTLKDPREVRGREVRGATACQAWAPSATCVRCCSPIYFWISAFKWGAIVIAGFLLFAAILQVGNTIRLAAFARRREIGIMRLVGASSLYIQMPFLLEALFAAVVGVLLAAGAIGPFLYVVVYRLLRPNSNLVAWVDWSDGVLAIARDHGGRTRAHLDSDAPAYPEIPQSVSSLRYLRNGVATLTHASPGPAPSELPHRRLA